MKLIRLRTQVGSIVVLTAVLAVSIFLTPVTPARAEADGGVLAGHESLLLHQLLQQIPEFEAIDAQAKLSKIQVSLKGSSAARVLRSLRFAELAQKNPAAYPNFAPPKRLQDIFFSAEPIEFELRGATGNNPQVMPIADSINKHFSVQGYKVRFTAAPENIGSSLSRLILPLNSDSHLLPTEQRFLRERLVQLSPIAEATLKDKNAQRSSILSLVQVLNDVYSNDAELDAPSLERLSHWLNTLSPDDLKISSAGYNPYASPSDRNDETDYFRKLDTELTRLYDRADHRVELVATLQQIGFLTLIEKICADVTHFNVLRADILTPKPVGEGTGKTAGEEAIAHLNHQVSVKHSDIKLNPSVYEILVRNPDGHLNANISSSRWGIAQFGDGFYTSKDENYYYGHNAWTVNLKLDPKARRGTDYNIAGDGYVIVRNRNALVVEKPTRVDFSKSTTAQLFETSVGFLAAPSDDETNKLSMNVRYDALLEARARFAKLAHEDKVAFTAMVDQIEEANAFRKFRNAEYYELMFTLNFEENYLGSKETLLNRPRKHVNVPKIYVDALLRKYAYDSSPKIREMLTHYISLLDADSKMKAELTLAQHEKTVQTLSAARIQNFCESLFKDGGR